MRLARADLGINHRLLGGFGIAGAIFVALAIVVESRLATISELRRVQRDEILPRVAIAEGLENASVYMAISGRRFALTRDEHERKAFEDASSAFRVGADRLLPLLTSEDPPALRDVNALGEAYDRAVRGLFAVGDFGADEHLRIQANMAAARQAVYDPLRVYLAQQRARAAQMQDQIGDAVAQTRRTGLILGPLALAAMAITAVWTSRRVRGPLKALVAEVRSVTRRASEDDRAAPAAGRTTRRRDEITELSDAFATMVQAVRQRETALREREEELRVANDQLREADRRKNEFLGMLSHELRNPLAPIRNSLYILDHVAPTGEEARRAKAVANRQISHVTRLVDDLLDVTRIGRGKIELRRADLDLGGVAGRTADDYRALMRDRGIEFEVVLPSERVLVNGDETRLAQVLGNLLSNAAKFTPSGGRVTLSLQAQVDRAVVHVRDTGPGIEPEVLPTIFDPFTQGKQTLARSEGGLGLGLALVKGLVALHAGDVAAVSGEGARGTDFVVTLPLAHGVGDGSEVPERSGPGGSATTRRRVLVIDDNRDAADTLAQLVELLGYIPSVAYDPFAGLASASEDDPDVVLCDIGLPGIDGYEFARRFRARPASRDVRLVALSGYAQPEDVKKAVEAGFDAHIAKPADLSRIEEVLGAFTGDDLRPECGRARVRRGGSCEAMWSGNQ